MDIAALVSGGVDSAVMLHLLVEQGHRPVIFYIRIGMKEDSHFLDCSSEEDIELTTWLAKHYGLKMEVVPLHEAYWDHVMAYTLESVKQGLTPNPDVMCNRLIKFGEFEQQWGHGFDRIATGHYASTAQVGGIQYLATAIDPVKDQTDFLAQITYPQLQKLMFPIGLLPKQEVRARAQALQLPNAHRRDSQGICFLGKVNYTDFLRKYLGERQGDIIELETGTKLGHHHGYWFHTIGQRKGLNLGGGPWFVVKKDIETNTLFVSHGYDPLAQYVRDIPLANMHFISGNPFGPLDEGAPVKFKIRHSPEFLSGTLWQHGDGYRIRSDEPVSGVAAGQFGVVYDQAAHLCYGSGVIANS